MPLSFGFRGYDGNHAPKPPFVLDNDKADDLAISHFWVGGPEFGGFIDLRRKANVSLQSGASFVAEPVVGTAVDTNAVVHTITNPTVPITDIPFTLFGLVRPDTTAQGYFVSFGSAVVTEGAHLGVRNSSLWRFGIWGGGVVDAAPYSLTEPNWVVGTYDVTNGRLYHNGVLIGGPTALTYTQSDGTARIAATNTGGTSWNGMIKHCGIALKEWSAAEVFEFWNPNTRWYLYYELGRISYFFVPAAAPGGAIVVTPQMALTGAGA